jgi:hypothetical protein
MTLCLAVEELGAEPLLAVRTDDVVGVVAGAVAHAIQSS